MAKQSTYWSWYLAVFRIARLTRTVFVRVGLLFVLDRGIILSFWLFLSNLLLGAGLAMDAFSVSLANGLQEPYMKKRKMTLIAGVFGFFQFAMPFIGWICVNMLIGVFQFLWPLIPWISLILLCAIGGFMIRTD